MGSMSSSACSPPSVRGSSTTGAPRTATALRTPPASGKPWTRAGLAGDRAKEHAVGPPRGARTPEPVHPARGPGQDFPAGHAVVDGEGLDGPALLTRKAFFGHIPYPLIHIDTSYKIPEMIQYRDRKSTRLNSSH